MGELPAAASTGAVASWAALKVHLERGVGPLHDDVVAHHPQRLGVAAADLDLERLGLDPAEAPVQRPVAGGVGDGPAVQVLVAQGGQDADHGHPAAVGGGGGPDRFQRPLQLAPQAGQRLAGQGQRRRVDLQVEPVQLQGQAGVAGVLEDGLVPAQGVALVVDQEQLQLGPDGPGADPEPRLLQQLPQRLQAVLQPLGEGGVVGVVEPLAVDLDPHAASSTVGGPGGSRVAPR
jgi:hypothetical protein